MSKAGKSGGGWSRLTRRIASRHGYALTRIGFIGKWPSTSEIRYGVIQRERKYKLGL